MESSRRSSSAQRRSSLSYGRRGMQRRDSNMSNASIVSEVEMATDEAFSGPISESVPTSTVSFSYQRPRQRQGSITSFTYFQDENETPEYSDEAVEDVSDEDDLFMGNGDDRDLEAGNRSLSRRKSSGLDRDSAAEPLLRRFDSTKTDIQEHEEGGSFSQKFYIENEDLTMVVAGFSTSRIGYLVYIAICCLTGGLGYLLFRWFPRWRVNLIGRHTPLKDCSWAVVENQWGEFTVHNVASEEYGYPMSSVFNRPSKEQLNGHRYDHEGDLKEQIGRAHV